MHKENVNGMNEGIIGPAALLLLSFCCVALLCCSKPIRLYVCQYSVEWLKMKTRKLNTITDPSRVRLDKTVYRTLIPISLKYSKVGS